MSVYADPRDCADAIPRKRNNIRERRAKQAEKIRLEEVKAKMSAKKAQRMKKVRQPVLARITTR